MRNGGSRRREGEGGRGGWWLKKVLERLAEVLLPVGDAGVHHAAVDVVERLRVRPAVLDVVDLELDVRRDAVDTCQ